MKNKRKEEKINSMLIGIEFCKKEMKSNEFTINYLKSISNSELSEVVDFVKNSKSNSFNNKLKKHIEKNNIK